MRNVYLVAYRDIEGGIGKVLTTKGAFLKEEDVERAAEDFGFWGTPGYVLPITLYDDLEDYEKRKNSRRS